MKSNLRSILFSFAVTVAAAIGCDYTPPPASTVVVADAGNDSSASTSSSSGDAGAAGAAGSGTGGSTATSTASSSSSTGGPPAFEAHCAGTLSCGSTPCMGWTYDVVDDGTNVHITATMTDLITMPTPATCSNSVTEPQPLPYPPTPPSDDVAFPCFTGNWTFAIDRDTMIVYIYNQIPGQPVQSMTPDCN